MAFSSNCSLAILRSEMVSSWLVTVNSSSCIAASVSRMVVAWVEMVVSWLAMVDSFVTVH